MTWSDVYAVLRAGGLVSADNAARRDDRTSITGVAYDSRRVHPGNVFVAVTGLRADGATFAQQAIQAGAIAVVSERPAPEDAGAAWVTVTDARLALALLAAAYWSHPSRELQVVGITGTNGKTTTACLIGSIFDAAGPRCGVLGTIGYRTGDGVREAERTTPEAPDLQEMLREMIASGLQVCAMEVSSHALSLKRVEGMSFRAAVFTNLTRDHLDFHGNMDAYFQAKRRLFEILPPDAPAAINVDDPHGGVLMSSVARPVTYGIQQPADVRPGPLAYSLDGLRFDLHTPQGVVHVASKLVGRPNVYNILAATTTAVALGVPLEAIERGLAALDGVPGRFQIASGSTDDVTVVVDYAHTDDALRNLLETARRLTQGRIITVFGCGGDRDRTKRPLMGAVAGRLSDVVVVTSDNPRSEEPRRIIDDILRGITPDTKRAPEQRIVPIVDRREAITKAVQLARPGDLILLAGKGHEQYQVIGNRTIRFDDVAVAREGLAARRARSGAGRE
jgi:UDP-N-acetylmuramoyl-L-alanyl-D-glutamate--2,6-diaminopimelate ligase